MVMRKHAAQVGMFEYVLPRIARNIRLDVQLTRGFPHEHTEDTAMKKQGVLRTALFSLMLNLAGQSVALAGQWLTLGNTGFVSGDTTLTLRMPYVGQPSLSVQTDSPGDFKWISQNVPVTLNEQFKATKMIDKVMVCYKAPDVGSYISQIRLSQFNGPSQATVIHDDGTDLTSPIDACYISKLPNFKATSAVGLSLRLNLVNPLHKVWIGATMVHFK
jgi:hypothetical protein